MSEILLQVGVGGIFSILVLKEVFGFLHNRSKNRNGAEQTPVWYERKSLEEAINGLCVSIDSLKDSMGQQNKILQKMVERIISIQAEVHDIRDGQIEIEKLLRIPKSQV